MTKKITLPSGKTATLRKLIVELHANKIPHYGFKELCIQKNGKRLGYDILVNMNGKEELIPVVRLRSKMKDDGIIFSFDQKAVQKDWNHFLDLLHIQKYLLFFSLMNMENQKPN